MKQRQDNAVVKMPLRGRGALGADAQAEYDAALAAFCAAILEIRSRLDFAVSARGWCYVLENAGAITKGQFDEAERLISRCRKRGDLPLDICAEEEGDTDNLQYIDEATPEERALAIIDYIGRAHAHYRPFGFWDDQEFYVEVAVEKVDLKSLFSPTCGRSYVPITNFQGWSSINRRAAMMRRFSEWEAKGKRCVLLWCGDHDPGGLIISDTIKANFEELADATGWDPSDLVIDRFGLNADFIKAQRLTWIDNLETSSGKRLDDPKHPDHFRPYVQQYLKRFGVRKVEANALVVRPDAGRALCREAILRYVQKSAPGRYGLKLDEAREAVRVEVQRLLNERSE